MAGGKKKWSNNIHESRVKRNREDLLIYSVGDTGVKGQSIKLIRKEVWRTKLMFKSHYGSVKACLAPSLAPRRHLEEAPMFPDLHHGLHSPHSGTVFFRDHVRSLTRQVLYFVSPFRVDVMGVF